MFENTKLKEIKNEAKELLDENKKVIKVGSICLLIGLAFGINSTDKLYSKAFFELIEKLPESK